MTSARLLHDLQRAGFQLSIAGVDLAIDGPLERLDADALAMIRQHKAALIRYCAPSAAWKLEKRLADLNPDQREHLRYAFNERAGIAEFDGGMDRREAEKIAFDEVVAEIDQLEARSSNKQASYIASGERYGNRTTQNPSETPKRATSDVWPSAGDSAELFAGGGGYGLPDTGGTP
jgi:hypothetical protein